MEMRSVLGMGSATASLARAAMVETNFILAAGSGGEGKRGVRLMKMLGVEPRVVTGSAAVIHLIHKGAPCEIQLGTVQSFLRLLGR